MPPPLLEQVKEALVEWSSTLKDADPARMLVCMERLDAVVANGRGVLDPRLLHFLERRSYAKALEFVGADAASPLGSCGPRRG